MNWNGMHRKCITRSQLAFLFRRIQHTQFLIKFCTQQLTSRNPLFVVGMKHRQLSQSLKRLLGLSFSPINIGLKKESGRRIPNSLQLREGKGENDPPVPPEPHVSYL